MHERFLILAMVMLAIAPMGSEAASAPQARKRVSTPTTTKPPAHAAQKVRSPRWLGKLRKGKVPDARARVQRKHVMAPARRVVAVEAARKPIRLRALPKPVKVSFAPCAASLPEQAPREVKLQPGMDAAVFERQYRWPTGATLEVGFLDGSRVAREAVARTARAWTEHANLHFEFSLDAPPPDADILIRFDASGCTSYVGTSSKYHAEMGQASMHLCHIDQVYGHDLDRSSVPDGFRRIVLHEFGHAIGLHHEHQSPHAKIEWNEKVVYDYYGTHHGWDRDYVDMWVFRTLSSQTVDTSGYDPDSIMHYDFPAEFTTNGMSYGGSHILSALDEAYIAEVYPSSGTKKIRRKFERKIAIRNETTSPLDVQVVYETRAGRKLTWAPSDDPAVAPDVRVPAGAERMIDGKGRRAKVIARSTDGRATWSEWATEPLRISPEGGYLDPELQTYVIVIDGPPDPPAAQTREQLYETASQVLAAGRHEDARALFGEWLQRFPADPLVPWARFNVVVSWYQEQRYEEALQASYDLIVEHPKADATIYAWYYGGVASLQLGWCDGTRSYLEYVSDEESGAPAEWRQSAREYLDAVDRDPDRWCW